MVSLKFERDKIRTSGESVVQAAEDAVAEVAKDLKAHDLKAHDGPLPGTSGKHPIAEKIGTAITGGKLNAGTKGYMMVRCQPCTARRLGRLLTEPA